MTPPVKTPDKHLQHTDPFILIFPSFLCQRLPSYPHRLIPGIRLGRGEKKNRRRFLEFSLQVEQVVMKDVQFSFPAAMWDIYSDRPRGQLGQYLAFLQGCCVLVNTFLPKEVARKKKKVCLCTSSTENTPFCDSYFQVCVLRQSRNDKIHFFSPPSESSRLVLFLFAGN